MNKTLRVVFLGLMTCMSLVSVALADAPRVVGREYHSPDETSGGCATMDADSDQNTNHASVKTTEVKGARPAGSAAESAQ